MEVLQMVAILACSIFAGAAIYINVAEHPARLECGVELAATVFGPSYRRAAAMQASLAVLATIAGIAVAITGGSGLWLVGACLIFFVVPFTFLFIMSTNRRLLDRKQGRRSKETRALLERWGRLHAIRSVASLAASIWYAYLGVAS